MSIKIKKQTRPTLDITGPNGNAFAILNFTHSLLKQVGFDDEYCNLVITEMKSSNYKHLINTMVKFIGDFVDIETTEEITPWLFETAK